MTHPGARFREPPTVTDEVPFPAVVAELEGLGFAHLGRLERVGDAAPEVAAQAYAEEHRARFLAGKHLPAAVLVSPDATTAVVVDWWWDEPQVRMRSVRADGAVVETWRAWDRDPVLPRGVRAHQVDPAREQLLSADPSGGRTIVLSRGTVAEQWSAHRAQLDRVLAAGLPLVPVTSMAHVVALSEQLLAHDRLGARRVVSRNQLVVAPFLVLLLLMVVLPRPGPVLAALVVLVCSPVVLTRRFRLAVRYASVLRPRFRAGPAVLAGRT